MKKNNIFTIGLAISLISGIALLLSMSGCSSQSAQKIESDTKTSETPVSQCNEAAYKKQVDSLKALIKKPVAAAIIIHSEKIVIVRQKITRPENSEGGYMEGVDIQIDFLPEVVSQRLAISKVIQSKDKNGQVEQSYSDQLANALINSLEKARKENKNILITVEGSRVISVFADGELYDNVGINWRTY
jgi:hypothetical protein